MEQLANFLENYLEKNQKDFTTLSKQIWEFAEVGFGEVRSAKVQIDFLEQAGFVVEKNAGGIPTAFVARFGDGGPKIGFLGEYDALFALSQKAGSFEREEHEPGAPGHGCGHNLLGIGSLAAAVAAKEYIQKQKIKGTVCYYGCPAEEDGSGKMFLARAGYFSDLDAAFTWHPSSKNQVVGNSSLAVISALYRFTGRATHAAAQPHLGRSALDACELMNVGVNYLREHIIPEARVHYAYRDAGGGAPNVVQDHAALYYFIRAPKVKQLFELKERVDACAKGAALMTGTQLEIVITDGLCDYVPNKELSRLLDSSMRMFNGPHFDEAEKKLAQKFREGFPQQELEQRQEQFERDYGEKVAAQLKDEALMQLVLPLEFDPTASPGSTDVGDTSYACPTAQLSAACYAIGTPGHSWQLTAQSGCGIGEKGMLYAAKAMAHAGISAMQNPGLLKKAKEEYLKATGGKYICPVPDDVMPMLDGVK